MFDSLVFFPAGPTSSWTTLEWSPPCIIEVSKNSYSRYTLNWPWLFVWRQMTCEQTVGKTRTSSGTQLALSNVKPGDVHGCAVGRCYYTREQPLINKNNPISPLSWFMLHSSCLLWRSLRNEPKFPIAVINVLIPACMAFLLFPVSCTYSQNHCSI